MANVFTKSNNATPKPNRNPFPLSFDNNLTMKLGVITPVFCREVMPGDSAKINATFGFNMHPLVFPIQTKLKANLHFFYVRNRTLWRGWQDFITKQENLDDDNVPPYMVLSEENRDMVNTGKIGDYLGVPTVMYSNGLVDDTIVFRYAKGPNLQGYTVLGDTAVDAGNVPTVLNQIINLASWNNTSSTNITELLRRLALSPDKFVMRSDNTTTSGNIFKIFYKELPFGISRLYQSSATSAYFLNTLYQSDGVLINSTENIRVCFYIFDENEKQVVSYVLRDYNINAKTWSHIAALSVESDDNSSFYMKLPTTSDGSVHKYTLRAYVSSYIDGDDSILLNNNSSTLNVKIAIDATTGLENADRRLQDLPFTTNVELDTEEDRSNTDRIHLSTLPFRACEAVYNSFYRDDRNNPLLIDGKPYYNIFVEDKTGGADTNHYQLHKANWEQDVFTTAVQSPTQGVLPLVGITATGNMTFVDENGKAYYLQAELADDGTLQGISSYSSDMPNGTLRAMVDSISTGISINDFRNVNAFQRWLETGMRKGLRYKEMIEAHFGTSPTYSELDMPEFIGGMSRSIDINRVVQSVDDTANGKPLGTLGGYGTVFGNGGQTVTKYFDEHGFILGFLSIVPQPVYSQALNKQLMKTELLDYYFPEFAHVPFQPILNQEIAPLQCEGTQNSKGTGLKDVFGYQRAWYEYLSAVDEVHGDFRTSMRDYLINRTFGNVPQLGEDFLTVSAEEVNDVFADERDNDKVFGQIHFDVVMQRPIPEIGVPKLEA